MLSKNGPLMSNYNEVNQYLWINLSVKSERKCVGMAGFKTSSTPKIIH